MGIHENNMFVIVYDVTRKNTFDEALTYETLIKSSKKDAPIIWIGNKADLLSDDQLEELKEKGPSEYFSSKDGAAAEQVISNTEGGAAVEPVISNTEGGAAAEPVISNTEGGAVAEPIISNTEGGAAAEKVICNSQGNTAEKVNIFEKISNGSSCTAAGKVICNSQGNTAEKVNIFEKKVETSEYSSQGKDRKYYVLSAKSDSSSVFKKIVHEIAQSLVTKKSFLDKRRMFETECTNEEVHELVESVQVKKSFHDKQCMLETECTNEEVAVVSG